MLPESFVYNTDDSCGHGSFFKSKKKQAVTNPSQLDDVIGDNIANFLVLTNSMHSTIQYRIQEVTHGIQHIIAE